MLCKRLIYLLRLVRTLGPMSETNISANFPPEDWALVRSVPLMAGLLVSLSDLRTGPIGVLKEGFAPSQAIIEAGEGAANPIVASVVANIKEMAKKGERLEPPFEVSGKTPEQLKADVAAPSKRSRPFWKVKCRQIKPQASRVGWSRLLTKSPMRARRADFLVLGRKSQRGGIHGDQGTRFHSGCPGLGLGFGWHGPVVLVRE